VVELGIWLALGQILWLAHAGFLLLKNTLLLHIFTINLSNILGPRYLLYSHKSEENLS